MVYSITTLACLISVRDSLSEPEDCAVWVHALPVVVDNKGRLDLHGYFFLHSERCVYCSDCTSTLLLKSKRCASILQLSSCRVCFAFLSAP